MLDALFAKHMPLGGLNIGQTVAFVAIHRHDVHRASVLQVRRVDGFYHGIVPAGEARFHTIIPSATEESPHDCDLPAASAPTVRRQAMVNTHM